MLATVLKKGEFVFDDLCDRLFLKADDRSGFRPTYFMKKTMRKVHDKSYDLIG
jgi:hypothetical protein